MDNDRLEGLLRSALEPRKTPPGTDEEAARRVLARLGTLPRQKVPFWRLPSVLLDWQFAPAWPRMAALGSCAVLGFAIGLSGVVNQPDSINLPYSFVSGSDSGSIVFGADPSTEATP